MKVLHTSKTKLTNQKRKVKKQNTNNNIKIKWYICYYWTTSSSITLAPTGIGLMATPVSTATASGLSIDNELLLEIRINKYNKYKNQFERGQQTTKAFDNLYRNTLQDKIFDKNEYESLCITFIYMVMKKTLNLLKNFE